ncbi:hypothetical protein, partial [Streptomyces griseorubens]|uniref:hypothetical protein n=1 Tax=Streptomyces griseorubens TaxID=66897 RepID=UPI0035149C3B
MRRARIGGIRGGRRDERRCGRYEGENQDGEDDSPTSLPLHDVTCTNPDQLVAFTQEYGASTPQGEGVEAVL